jgi:hypothetical protein
VATREDAQYGAQAFVQPPVSKHMLEQAEAIKKRMQRY